MSKTPPECSWPSGHDWEGSRVQLQEDDSVVIEQDCRWCRLTRYGTPITEIFWVYEERP